jgi:hypothetical protein
MAWKEIMEIGLHDLANEEHLQVRYEDLIADPLAVVQRVMSYLDLDLAPSVAEFTTRITDDTASPYHAQLQQYWYRNDHRVRVGRWRENLTRTEQGTIETALEPLLKALGYAV